MIKRAQVKVATRDKSLEAAGHLAVERGEDDGMIVQQDVTPKVNSREDLNAITTR
jgi:hypothetical protein